MQEHGDADRMVSVDGLEQRRHSVRCDLGPQTDV
jgi:hypothetical protein